MSTELLIGGYVLGAMVAFLIQTFHLRFRPAEERENLDLLDVLIRSGIWPVLISVTTVIGVCRLLAPPIDKVVDQWYKFTKTKRHL